MSALLAVVLPVFLVMGAGFGAVRTRFLAEDAIDALMRFAQGLAVPLLLFLSIARLDLTRGYDAGLLGSYYMGSTAVFLLGMGLARLLFRRAWDDAVSIGFSAFFPNSVLLGLAITERAWGPQALEPNFAIISVHALFCYTVGIAAMETVRNAGGSWHGTVRAIGRAIFRNTLMLAILAGFAVNLTGLPLPGPVTAGLDLIARAALPVALFALGGVLTRYRPEGDWREVALVVVLSLAVHPAITWTLATQAFALPQGMVRSATLTAAMAPGVNSFVFASIYGAARRVAATSVLVATALSVLTTSVWLTILGV